MTYVLILSELRSLGDGNARLCAHARNRHPTHALGVPTSVPKAVDFIIGVFEPRREPEKNNASSPTAPPSANFPITPPEPPRCCRAPASSKGRLRNRAERLAAGTLLGRASAIDY